MNTRARVKAIPVLVAASMGLGSVASFSRVFAQDSQATPAQIPTGFPELELTVDESGVHGVPESIEAGRYLVKVTGPDSGESGETGAIFIQLPEGHTAESIYEYLLNNPDQMPEWYLDLFWGGGVILNQASESWAVIDFTPGVWTTTTPYGSTLGVSFEATGEMPTERDQPEANVTLELGEMVINIVDGEFVAGDNVVHVANIGAQIHFVDVMSVPDGTTEAQVEALMDSFMTGTPPAEDALAEDDAIPFAYLPEISGGIEQTWPLHLEAGTYFLSCWVADLDSGLPHAMMGMWTLITVE